MSSEPVIRANQWLKDHKNLNFPEWNSEDDPDQWHRVLVIYHLWCEVRCIKDRTGRKKKEKAVE
ncbi:MAG: hypothetical protein R3B93_17645 [Bacteroidia bacterium]